MRPLVERLLGAESLAATELTDPRNQTHGNVSCWGSDQPQAQSFFFMPHRYGLRLDRPRFDQALRQRTLAAGVDVRMGSALRRAEAGVADGVRWRCNVTAGDTAAADDTILARILLDCSGRRASIARSRGVRRYCGDRLFAFAR
ncbi:MAG TPA: hypothetical protein EYP90_09350, partial [Chromatiaceae bacterium]|nr:hypothetical protein [Chromatiaceae bacterium]